MTPEVFVYGAVEGIVDETVLRRLLTHVGGQVAAVYGKRGKQALLQRLEAYNQAAERDHTPWVVLVDLDRHPCPVAFRREVLPNPAPRMCFRIVVRAVEAWLLADRERMARFLHVSPSLIPLNPETLPDPKASLVQIATRSHSREIREDMVPRTGSGHVVGPAYPSRLQEFIMDRKSGWRPDVAAASAPSLRRALNCLQRLVTIN